MEVTTNGATNGTTENGVDNDVNKKLRASRLTKDRITSLMPIKIEDDSDEETEPRTKSTANGSVECEDKAVQTDNMALMEMVRKMVQERMRQYAAAAADDKCIFDKQLSPKLEKLERENEDLRKYAMVLKSKLDHKEQEKQSLKRPYEDIAAPSHVKSSAPTIVARPPPPYTVAMGNVNNPVVNTNTVATTRMMNPRNTRPPPPPPLLPANSAFSQPRPLSNVLMQPRVPLQVPNNVRQISPGQPMMRHPFARNDRFMLPNNNNIPMSGINNTHVVNSNPGLRMTSISPDISNPLRPPLDTRALAPNMAANGQLYNQYMQQRMPSNVMNSQMRPIQNPTRPFGQLPPPQQQQQQQQQQPVNVPPPLSPLPKLTANISTSNNAIVLTWDFESSSSENKEQYKVECYQLFAHQAKDARVSPPLDTKQWKKIGVVNALPLPMACTLTQFASGSVYFFAVVAVDVNGREGEMSNPCVIRLDVNR